MRKANLQAKHQKQNNSNLNQNTNTMKNTVLAVALLVSGALMAQQAKVVSAINALGYYQKDKTDIESLQKGRGFIEEAIGSESTQGKPKTWWVRGNIYRAYLESKDSNLMNEAPDAMLLAAESYEKAFTLDQRYENSPECFSEANRFYMSLGIAKFNQKNFIESTSNFEKAINLYKLVGKINYDAISNAAAASFNGGLYDKAIEYYSNSIERDSSGNIYIQIYKSYIAKGDTMGGEAQLDAGRLKFPNNQTILTEKLNCLFRAKKNVEAEELLKLAIQNDPTNHILYLAAGSTYESLGQMDDAINAYKKAIELKPDAWQAYYNLGAYHNNKGKELQDAANNEKDTKKYEAGKKVADAQLNLAMEYLEKAKELTEAGSSDRMDIMRALKQIYAFLNLTEKFEAIKKEMQQ